MKSTMESYFGAYDKTKWRIFSYGSDYIEMGTAGFSSLAVGPGDAFWAISLETSPAIQFTGRPAPDGDYYTIPLKQGWNMFGLPWPEGFPDIDLCEIAVSDGVNNYEITSGDNNLTQQGVWDYTGTGGYVMLTSCDTLQTGKGYWIKVESALPVELLIPPENDGGFFTAMGYKDAQATTNDDEEPPAPPGGVTYDVDVTTDENHVSVAAEGGCFISTLADGSGF
jgi:hypothetical protein